MPIDGARDQGSQLGSCPDFMTSRRCFTSRLTAVGFFQRVDFGAGLAVGQAGDFCAEDGCEFGHLTIKLEVDYQTVASVQHRVNSSRSGLHDD